MNKLTTIVATLIALGLPLSAQETVITQETTKTTVIADTSQAALVQAYKTLLFLNNKEIKLTGDLYYSAPIVQGRSPTYMLLVDELRIKLKLDDGRKVAKKVESCDTYNIYSVTTKIKPSNCTVSMIAELRTDSHGRVILEATGWDLEFEKYETDK